MPRLYRPSELYEVCQRTNRGEFLIDLNDVEKMQEIVGILAEAQRRYRVEIYAFHLMSNHYHGLFGAPSPQVFANFLGFFHAGVARRINRDLKIPGVVWGGKPHVRPVALDQASLLRRVAYIMGQALRADLVRHPAQFPGPSSVDWLIAGQPILGIYVDHTARYRADRLKNPPEPPRPHEHQREVVISKLPCFQELSWAELHPLFMALADRLAGLTLAQLASQGLLSKVASIDLARAGHLDAAEQGEDQEILEIQGAPLRQINDQKGEIEEDRPVDLPPKLPMPDALDPESGTPQRRGPPPPKPGQRGRRKIPLIHASSDAARERYAEELQMFLKEHRQARLRLERQLSRGGSVRRLRLPKYALLGGNLAGPCGG